MGLTYRNYLDGKTNIILNDEPIIPILYSLKGDNILKFSKTIELYKNENDKFIYINEDNYYIKPRAGGYSKDFELYTDDKENLTYLSKFVLSFTFDMNHLIIEKHSKGSADCVRELLESEKSIFKEFDIDCDVVTNKDNLIKMFQNISVVRNKKHLAFLPTVKINTSTDSGVKNICNFIRKEIQYTDDLDKHLKLTMDNKSNVQWKHVAPGLERIFKLTLKQVYAKIMKELSDKRKEIKEKAMEQTKRNAKEKEMEQVIRESKKLDKHKSKKLDKHKSKKLDKHKSKKPEPEPELIIEESSEEEEMISKEEQLKQERIKRETDKKIAMARQTIIQTEVISRNKKSFDILLKSNDFLQTIKDRLTSENEKIFQCFCNVFLS